MATESGESNSKSSRTSSKSQFWTRSSSSKVYSAASVKPQSWQPGPTGLLYKNLQPPSMQQGKSRFQVSASEKQTFPGVASKRLNVQQACQLQQQLMAFDFTADNEDRKVVLGICAMAKKSHSKPMNEIIGRLRDNFDRLQVLVFDEDTILNKPVEDWPVVNGLVSFFSHGFPLDKAIAYKNLRNPFVVNDLEMQYVLQDRRKVYAILEENNIPHPRYAVLDRKDPQCVVSETEDSIEVNGSLFMKPFVEKPVSAEDHNIYIYFPVAAGGGSTRLFRKVKDRSSIYSRFCRVRTKGSFLYEDFMPTDGTDVKVYTVGPDYQHAEARKSPALDGKVERDPDGKEIRYPVLLNNKEKMIARSVCRVFKQNVCGFDLLRANGKHYVCDVNGFSFVKTSSKYYDDCAKILGTLVMRACCPQLHIPFPMCVAPEDIPVVQTTTGYMMELRCVIAVIRHGDRTPKQKMKMEVKNKKFFELFEKYGGFKSGQLKLKKPKQLQEVLDIVRHLLTDSQAYADPEVEEKKAKLNQLKLVLEMYGHFSGINRKVQLKYQPNGRPQRSSSEEDETPRDPSLVLILKWGGELTPAGRIQAENLGKAFRTLYPGGQGQFEAPGLGFLRLHSTFRHDLKIYASDEGRVQMTAAAFTKGLLALEGELTPIVVQMVKSANTNGLLDGESNTSKYHIVVKEKLKEIFNQDRDFTEADFQKLAATNSISLVNAMQFVKNPYQMCLRVHEMIQEITARIRCLKMELKSRDLTLFNGESWELLIRRWAKLEKDFCLKNGRFDVSKIPDIYDCIKYDLQHNQKTLQFQRAQELFMCSKALADIVVPQEYGITKEERLHIGQNYCTPLLRKIRCDLLQCINEPNLDDSTTRLDSKYSNGVASPERFVRTRLYFTSESHIHSLLSMLRYGDFLDEEKDDQWKRSMDFVGACAELNYMSQIVLMMFEDPAKPEDSDDRFHIELHFSPGAYTSCDQMGAEPKGMGFRPKGASTIIGESVEEVSESSSPSSTLIPEPSSQDKSQEDPTLGPSSSLDTVDKEKDSLTVKPPVRNCMSVPDATALDDLGELAEADIFSHGHSGCHSDTVVSKKQKKKAKFVYEPHSPDPNTPEWDWGEEDSDREDHVDQHHHHHPTPVRQIGKYSVVPTTQSPPPRTTQAGASERSPPPKDRAVSVPRGELVSQNSFPVSSVGGDHQHQQALDPSQLSLSLPKSVERMLRLQDLKDLASPEEGHGYRTQERTNPIDINVTTPDPNKTPLDEKRSRSLEDSGTDLSPQQGGCHGQRMTDTLQLLLAVIQRNYRTIHLPLAQDAVMKPLSSFFFYTQTPRALEGFSNVPLLHPLETLHNNLTFHQVDDFLGRVTLTRFPVPDISGLDHISTKSLISLSTPSKMGEFPNSASSSGGPNSPTLAPNSTELIQSLGLYINTQTEGGETTGSEGGKQETNSSQNSTTSEDPSDVDVNALTGSLIVTLENPQLDLTTSQTTDQLDDLVIK